MGPYDFANTLSKYGEQAKDDDTLNNFKTQIGGAVNKGAPTFSSAQQRVEPLTLDQYKNPDEVQRKDTRTLQEKQRDYRNENGLSSIDSFSDIASKYMSPEENNITNPVTDATSTIQSANEFSMFVDKTERPGPTPENLEKLKKGTYFENDISAVSNFSNTVPDIVPETDYAFGGNQNIDSDTYYSTVDGVTKGKKPGGKKLNVGKTAGTVMGIADFGVKIGQAYSTVNENGQKGEFSQGLGLVMSGASAGASIGGVWGAIIGAVVAGGVNVTDAISDRKKVKKKASKLYNKKMSEAARRRKRDYVLSKQQKRNNALTAYHEAQLGYVNLNNY